MRIRIHRGAHEIGGNCIEVESAGKSILLDLGMPLSGAEPSPDLLPNIRGLRDGTNPSLLALMISHPHADHYGLASFAHPSIPVYIGREADKLLRAASIFSPFGVEFPNLAHYRHRIPLRIGPFTLTPYLIDHSAFDAYSFLIEANGRKLFYSGDLRGHGWKSKLFDQLVSNPPKKVDAMLLEGTTLGRDEASQTDTEADLVPRIAESLNQTRGLALCMFAGQNIDRFVTFYKAARHCRRGFAVDLYLAHLLRSLERKTLPDPTTGALRVYLPRHQKLKVVRQKRFDLVSPFRARRIFPEEIAKRRDKLAMVFRSSMVRELENAGCLEGGRLIYSMWPGYLDRSQPDLRKWCVRNGLEFEVIHTSGHADKPDLKRLVQGIAPRTLIPIHTVAAKRFSEIGPNVALLRDGQWHEL